MALDLVHRSNRAYRPLNLKTSMKLNLLGNSFLCHVCMSREINTVVTMKRNGYMDFGPMTEGGSGSIDRGGSRSKFPIWS